MSRFDSWLAELQPEMFAEISPELAADRGVANGDWVVISTPRGEIETKALVTPRMKPVFIDGRAVHTVGMPIHWGYSGEVVGASVNDLTAMVLEANTSIHESKSFVCQLRAGRREGVKTPTPLARGASQPRKPLFPTRQPPRSRQGGRCMPSKQPCREIEVATLPQAALAPQGFWLALLARFVDPFRRGVIPEAQAATGFYTDTTVCIGCKACEVACKQWNQLPADGYELSGKSYDNTVELSATSWRHVKFIEQFPIEDFQPVTVPLAPVPADGPYPWQGLSLEPMTNRWLMMSDVCKHCVTAPCQQACPTARLFRPNSRTF